MLKYAVAIALTLTGFTVSAAAQSAPEPRPYGTRLSQLRDETGRPLPAVEPTAENDAPAASANGEQSAEPCGDCPPPKKYDQVDVIKKSRDVDRSRVINTETVVHVPPRVKEHNRLVIHENETRNVGVILHKHRIIEKEIRYVRRKPAYRLAVVPVVVQQPSSCGCSSQSYLTYQYAYVPTSRPVRQAVVPVEVPAGYGYR